MSPATIFDIHLALGYVPWLLSSAPISGRGSRRWTRMDYGRWLGEEPADPPHLMAALKPFAAEAMEAYPVSPRVGNVKNTDAALFEPLEAIS